MPDLDGELTELRESLHGSLHQPSLDKVIERSRQRSTRRRTQIGAVAAVLVVGAAIPVLRTTLEPVRDDPVTAMATPTQTTDPSSPYPAAGPFLYDIDFADAMHGFAVRVRCADPYGKECTNELLVTEDAEHWQVRSLPAAVTNGDTGVSYRLIVFGPRSVVFGEINPPGVKRFYSADAGRTWASVPSSTQQSVAAIPDGGVLDSGCAVATDAPCHPRMVAIQPDSGQALALESQPPLQDPLAASKGTVAGGWWAAGKDPASGRWMLAVSRDAGRSWSTAGLPSWTTNTWTVAMAAHGTTLYATVNGEQKDAKNGLVAMFRSGDGGLHWEQTFNGDDGNEPRSIVGSAVAAADGRLIVATEGGTVWGSTDGGKTFQVMPNAEFAGWVTRTRAGYLASTSAGQSTVYKLSADGVRWTEITIG